MILRLIVVVAGLFTLLLLGFIYGIAVDPIYDVVIDSGAVQAQGYDEAISVARYLGGTLALVMLGIAVLIWAHAAEFHEDPHRRRRL